MPLSISLSLYNYAIHVQSQQVAVIATVIINEIMISQNKKIRKEQKKTHGVLRSADVERYVKNHYKMSVNVSNNHIFVKLFHSETQ